MPNPHLFSLSWAEVEVLVGLTQKLVFWNPYDMKWFNKAKRISPNRHSIEPCSSRNSDTFWPVVGAVYFKFNSLTLLMAQKCIAGQRPISLPCPGMAQAYPYFWGFLHYFDTLCPCNFISLHFFFLARTSLSPFLSSFPLLTS